MPNLNVAIIEGHASRDVEIRHTQSGRPVANIGVATNNYNGKNKESTPEWHNVTAWGQLAENASSIKKGWIVRVHGRIQTRSWEKDGQKHYKTEIIADALNAEPPRGDGQQQQVAQAPQRQAQRKPASPPFPAEDEYMEDDIPF